MPFHKVKIETDVSKFSFKPEKTLVGNKTPKLVDRNLQVSGDEINYLLKNCKVEFDNLFTGNELDIKYVGFSGTGEVSVLDSLIVQKLTVETLEGSFNVYRTRSRALGVWSELKTFDGSEHATGPRNVLWTDGVATTIDHQNRVSNLSEGTLGEIKAILDGNFGGNKDLVYLVSDKNTIEGSYVEFKVKKDAHILARVVFSEGEISSSSTTGSLDHKSVEISVGKNLIITGSTINEINLPVNTDPDGYVVFGIEHTSQGLRMHVDNTVHYIHMNSHPAGFAFEFFATSNSDVLGSSVELKTVSTPVLPNTVDPNTVTFGSKISYKSSLDLELENIKKHIQELNNGKPIPTLGYFDDNLLKTDTPESILENTEGTVLGRVKSVPTSDSLKSLKQVFNKLIPNSTMFKLSFLNSTAVTYNVELVDVSSGKDNSLSLRIDSFNPGSSVVFTSTSKSLNNGENKVTGFDIPLADTPLEIIFEIFKDGRVYVTLDGRSVFVHKQKAQSRLSVNASATGMSETTVDMTLVEDLDSHVPVESSTVTLLNSPSSVYSGFDDSVYFESEEDTVVTLENGDRVIKSSDSKVAATDLWLSNLDNKILLDQNVNWNLNETPKEKGRFSVTDYTFEDSIIDPDLGKINYGHPASVFDSKLLPGTCIEVFLTSVPAVGQEIKLGLFCSNDVNSLSGELNRTIITRLENGQLISEGLDPNRAGFNTANGVDALPLFPAPAMFHIEYTLDKKIMLHGGPAPVLISEISDGLVEDLIIVVTAISSDVETPVDLRINTLFGFSGFVHPATVKLGESGKTVSVLKSSYINDIKSGSKDIEIVKKDGEVKVLFKGDYVDPDLLQSELSNSNLQSEMADQNLRNELLQAIAESQIETIEYPTFSNEIHLELLNPVEKQINTSSMKGEVSKGLHLVGRLDCYISGPSRFSVTLENGIDSGALIDLYFTTNGIETLSQETGMILISLGADRIISAYNDAGVRTTLSSADTDSLTLNFELDDGGLKIVDSSGSRISLSNDPFAMYILEAVVTGGDNATLVTVSIDDNPLPLTGEALGLVPLNELLDKAPGDSVRRIRKADIANARSTYGNIDGSILHGFISNLLELDNKHEDVDVIPHLPYDKLNPNANSTPLVDFTDRSIGSASTTKRIKSVWGTEAIEVPEGFRTFMKITNETTSDGSSKIYFVPDGASASLDMAIILNDLPSEGAVERVLRIAGRPDVNLPPKPAAPAPDTFYLSLAKNIISIYHGENGNNKVDTFVINSNFHIAIECLNSTVRIGELSTVEYTALSSKYIYKDRFFIPAKAVIKRKTVHHKDIDSIDSRPILVDSVDGGLVKDKMLPFSLPGENKTSYLSIPMAKGSNNFNLIKFSESSDGKALDVSMSNFISGLEGGSTRLKTNNNTVIGKYNGANVISGDKGNVITSVTEGTTPGSVKIGIPPVLDADADYVFTVQLLDSENKRVVVDQQLDHVTVSVYVSGVLTDTPFRFRIDFD